MMCYSEGEGVTCGWEGKKWGEEKETDDVLYLKLD